MAFHWGAWSRLPVNAFGPEPTEGELVACYAHALHLAPHDERAGTCACAFPTHWIYFEEKFKIKNKMISNFKNKTAVLTGAGSGFGLECARIGAKLGMNIVLVDVQQDALGQGHG